MFYVLDEQHNPVEVTDPRVWEEMFGNIAQRRVGLDIIDGVRVSTVFLVIDHNFSNSGPPLLFETLIQTADHDHLYRFATWDAAQKFHNQVVQRIHRMPILTGE